MEKNFGRRRSVYSLPAYAGWKNQQLTKNCGIVPYLLHKNYGFRAVMAGAKVDSSYPSVKYVEGMEVEFLEDGAFSTKLRYIRDRASDIDLLILHGYYPDYEEMVKLYRSLRPDGKIYLELDMNLPAADRVSWRMPNVDEMLGACDVIGVSCRFMQRYMMRKCSHKMEYIPNGFYDFGQGKEPLDFSKKENIILTSGRIGSPEKKNEILMEAFAAVADDMPGWSLRLVGGIEKEFVPYVEHYFSRFPSLRERVTFSGLIVDRRALMEEYRRSRIFVLTSPSEGGTPNVMAEALTAGNYIVTSAIDAAWEAVDEGRCGEVFRLGENLARILRERSRDEERISRGGRHAADYARKYFDFERIVDRLYYLLYGGCCR